MLERLITHIRDYEALGQRDIAFDMLTMIITRLYQVDASQIQPIPASILETLCSMLMQRQSEQDKASLLLVSCEQALSVVERYRLHHPDVLVSSDVALGNVIADLSSKAQTASADHCCENSNDSMCLHLLRS